MSAAGNNNTWATPALQLRKQQHLLCGSEGSQDPTLPTPSQLCTSWIMSWGLLPLLSLWRYPRHLWQLIIFWAAVHWFMEGGLINRRKLCALSAFESILQPSQLTGHRDWGDLHIFCLSVWCFSTVLFWLSKSLECLSQPQGRETRPLKADSAKTCMWASQKSSATKTLGASPAEKDQLQVCGCGRRKSFAPELRGP